MEDEKQQPAEAELTSLKKKKREGFLSSWLQRRRLPLEMDAVAEEPSESAETKKLSLSERFGKLLKNPFKKEVEVAYVQPESEKQVDEHEPYKPAPADWFETKSYLEHTAEEDEPTKKDIDPTEKPTDKDEETEGLLLVSADAQQRQQLRDSIENRSRFKEAEGSEIIADKPKPKKEVIEKTKVVNESIDHPILPTNTMALSTGEILRRQREKHLKRQVEQLKREAKSADKERAEIKKQQQEFQRQLVEQDKQAHGLVEKATKVETQKPPIQGEIDLTKTTEYTPVPLGQEAILPKPEKPQTEKYKEIVTAPPPERPEIILNTVEKAAEKNVPIESLYEKRHESKDDSKILAQARAAVDLGAAAANRLRTTGFYQPPPMMPSAQKPQPINPRTVEAQPTQGGMYKQAALSGVSTALVICALLILWILVT